MTRVAIIATGNELLSGETVNSTTPLLIETMVGLGYQICKLSTVPDDVDSLRDAIRDAIMRSDLIFITGGLGPTPDDLTREALAEAISQPLEFKPDLWEDIQAYFKKRGRPVPSSNINQAYLPCYAMAIPNRLGTAPGIKVEFNGRTLVALPGPPGEVRPMLNDLLPELEKRYPKRGQQLRRTFKICGLGETQILERIKGLLDQVRELPVKFSYLPKGGEVHLGLMVEGEDQGLNQELFISISTRLKQLLAPDLYGIDKETLPGRVGELLRQNGQTLAVAESCTGGLLADQITSVPGSSDYFLGGVVAYQNEAKESLLGVSAETLLRYHAVSAETAAEMAEGTRLRFGSDLALATTGFAGPDGGLPDRPVGTVFIGIATPDRVNTERLYYPGFGRTTVKLISVKRALDLLRRQLEAEQNV